MRIWLIPNSYINSICTMGRYKTLGNGSFPIGIDRTEGEECFLFKVQEDGD